MRDQFNSYRMGERFPPPAPGQPLREGERPTGRAFAEERIMSRKPEDLRGIEVDIIVTSHEGVAEYLYSLGVSSRNGVARYARHADIEGQFVAGQVPFYMATLAAAVMYVGMRIPREWKGQDLSVEDVRSLHPQIGIYRAERLTAEDVRNGALDEHPDEPRDAEPEIIPISPTPLCSGTRKRHRWINPADVGDGEQESACAHCGLIRRVIATTLTVLEYRRPEEESA